MTSGTGSPDRATLARAVSEAVRAVPGVAGLSPGHHVQVGTQFAGGVVAGVALFLDSVAVHLVVDCRPLVEVVEPARAAAVAALRSLGDPRTVEVVVEDIVIEPAGGRT